MIFILIYKALFIVNIIINSIFIFECIVKVISLGFIIDKGSYLRDNWSKLDFLIVIVSILDISLSGKDVGALKVI
jgi:hypothetical protein